MTDQPTDSGRTRPELARTDRNSKTRAESLQIHQYDRSDAAGTRIGRYEIIRRLGGGGFGFVYLASDPQLRRQVAVKVPRWDRRLSAGSIDQFLQEGKMLAQVSHPSIVAVHDVGTTNDGMPFVVMEFVEGEPLSSLLKNSPLAIEGKVELLLQIAHALQAAHKKGLVHRDLKPANVIVGDDGEVHLVDFGLALHDELSVEEWESDAVAGTPNYMAPEQIRGENHLIDGQTDIWAFGVTMYRMLVGVLPFRRKGYRDLMRSICYKKPKPPRQLSEQVPRQLERICLRCLEKLMQDRYQSMADVIEELQAYLEERVRETELIGTQTQNSLQNLDEPRAGDTIAPTESSAAIGSRSGNSDTPGAQSNTPSAMASRTGQSLTIIPKGLRPFDQNDKEFFLSLLPGPTDRLGIPESIRFWTSRLGTVDQVDSVPIGIIYGPSGSGKSSFVRAGLVPRLPENVIDLYVDCTIEHLEQYVSDQLCRLFDDIPPGEQLSKTLRDLRNGKYLRQGDKLLIVLDQFEQWLTRSSNLETAELTEALRQCDAERVQSLILIRDEFWLSTSQYLRFLGQRIEERRNAMPLPLFDKRHASRVLRAIGRAHEVLPPDPQPLSKSQTQFIADAINSLADRDRVVCVHLTVFAEATKNSPWDANNLRTKGGLAGIGREYVTGIFNNPETPNFIKRHSHEAWGILKQLLTPSTQLKGAGVSRLALLEDSEVQMSRPTFDGLMKFLEFDCNLISQMESESEEDTAESELEADQKYSLTHDFLVNPIREWGQAKQNESAAGRAKSDFNTLAGQWKLTTDRRFLPSLWDFGRFSLLVDPALKSQNREYWQSSSRSAAMRSVAGLATILLIATLALGSWGSNRARRTSQFNEYLVCTPEKFGDQLQLVLPKLASLSPELLQATNHKSANVRFRAFCAMLCADPKDEEAHRNVIQELGNVDFDECRSLYEVTRFNETQLIPVWSRTVDGLLQDGNSTDVTSGEEASDEQKESFRIAARLAIPMAHLGHPQSLSKLMSAAANPLPRTIALTELPSWHLQFDHLLQSCDMQAYDKENGDLLSGICCGIGLAAEQIQASERIAVAEQLKDLYATNNHGGVHYAAWYALNQLKISVPDVVDETPPERQWRTLRCKLNDGLVIEVPMVRIATGNFVIGDGHPDTIKDFELSPPLAPTGTQVEVDHSFWISISGMSNQSCMEIFSAKQSLSDDARSMSERLLEELSKLGDDQRRIQDWKTSVAKYCSFPGAAEIANFLSQRFDLPEYYSNIANPENLERRAEGGFRLPQEYELELAIRCGSKTKYYVGNDIQLAERLIGKQRALDGRKLVDFPPNANGLFGCGVYRDRLDLVRKSTDGWAALFRGGFTSPASSAELALMNYEYRLGSFRLTIDEERMPEP